MIKKQRLVLIIVTLFLATVSFVNAQVTAGRVNGSVTDANGAVISGGTVSLRSKTTGLTLNTETTSSGAFLFPNVLPGEYEIRIERSGFQTITQTVIVSLNQDTTVNATLPVAGTGTTVVDVTTGADALVQTDSSQLGKSFQTRQVEELPIFGNQNALALLSPNVVGQSAGTAGSGGTVGGVRPRYNIFTTDGVENNDPSVTGPATSPIQDAVAEFTLLTNSFNAEFGQGGGGQFVTVTKSGTNEFHGNAFAYLQHQRLNAASTVEEQSIRSGAIGEKPRYRDVRYGFTLGGPIVKDKLFFFGALQRNPVSFDSAGEFFNAPTQAGLSQLAALPQASPYVINLLRNYVSLPTVANSTENVFGVDIPIGTTSIVVPGGNETNQYQLNIDYNANERNQFRFRYSQSDYTATEAGYGSDLFNNNVVYDTKLFSGTWIRTFGASAVNDLRLSYRKTLSDYPLVNPDVANFPNINLLSIGLTIGPGGNLPQSGFDHSYQIFDSFTYIKGSHTFKFGAEYRNLIATSNFLPRSRGDYYYLDLESLVADVGPPDGFALKGVGSGGFVGNNQKYYFFAQDDWKVTPNLTLNLGVRYEFVTLPRDAALQELNSLASVPGVLEFRKPAVDKNNWAPRVGFAYSPTFGENRLTNFLFGEGRKTSIRGNFSMSYAEVFQNLVLLQLPPQFQQEMNNIIARDVFGMDLSQNFLQNGGLPSTPLLPTTTSDARAVTGNLIADQRLGEVYAFSLGFQRELSSSMALEIRYLGTRSRHLPIQTRLNGAFTNPAALTIPTFLSDPTPAQLAGLTTLGAIQARSDVGAFPLDDLVAPDFFGGFITSFEPAGNSNYDAGSVTLTRRFTSGLSFSGSYTFSKTLSDTDNELFTSVVNPRRIEAFDNVRNEWSLSTFDIPHRFVFSANWSPTFFNEKGGAWKTVLGDFVIAPIFQIQSGQPITPLSGIDSNLNFDGAGDRTIVNPNGIEGTASNIRAVNAAGETVALGSPNTVAYVALNPNAQYIRAGQGARSTAGRNTLRTNGFNRTDVTVLKNFKFGEDRYNLQVGTEIFNVWNQRIRTIGGLDQTGNSFANTGSTVFGDYSFGNFGGRTIQIRAKFIF